MTSPGPHPETTARWQTSPFRDQAACPSRSLQKFLPVLLSVLLATACAAAEPPRVATFRCDVTPPKGQPLFYGDPLETVAEPLLAKGIVIESAGRRHVLCAIDWCAVSNGTHLSLRRRLAEAVGGRPDDVAVQTLHQHSAPLVDIDAQRILAEHGDATAHVDPAWLAATEARIAAAAKESLAGLQAFDRVGAGKARVDRIASNRRVRDAAGAVAGRTSLAPAPLRELPEGRIDPFVRTVTLAAGDEPLVRLHYYATHPQVNYGDGVATSDFVGLAREEMERREGVAQVYFTGCAGDVTVGKYNDGSDTSRRAFADRLLAGMAAAIAATSFEPAHGVEWRTHPFLPPRRRDGDFAAAACIGRMRDPRASPVDRLYRGALRLASVRREGEPIVLSGLRLGSVHLLHLPGEPLVDFQLFAQRLLPDEFVAVAAYGDNATGYICTAEEFAAGGYEASVSICTPEVDGLLRKGIAALLQPADAVVEPLPRIPPREPAAALGSFSLAPGYRIEQAAAEPLVRSPVALDFDERGRCFVVEMVAYAEQEHERLGAIRLLEDADGDGRFDTGRVFAAGLSWPTGVLCADGGLCVCAAPDILHLRDDDGDGVADTSRVVFTGFGRGNLQGFVNSLRCGLDGRIHGATSSAGAPRVVRPDDPSFEPVDLDGRDFSFDPRRLDLRPEAGCLQHGMTFDDWGRKFVSGNSDPVEMVFYEDRYAARNPFHALPPSRGPIAVDGGAAEVFRTSPVEPWRVLRTRMRNADPSLGPVEAGPFLEARRVDRGSEFARSDDVWFRPAQFANGPDGTLYVIDMYREVIEYPKSLPPEIKQHFDLASGSDRGRIYRIVPDGFVPRPRDDLSSMSTGQLVALLAHRNGWHRDAASRLLCERQDAAAAEPLERLARESLLPEGRMHAMDVLAARAKLTVPAVMSRIGTPETGAWLLARWSQLGPGLRSAAAAAVFGRTEWVRAFFGAVEEGRVPPSDVDPAQVRLLAIRREPMIRAGYARLAERLQTSPRREVLAAYRPALGLPGDAARGAAHFARACAQCHRLAGVGHEVGPSLAGIAQRGPEAILLHVLDPNREVNPLYLTYVAELVDGRVVTGMIADETAAGVTLRRAEAAADTIRRADIGRLESTGQSLMPEGLEKQLDVQAVADLIAHLMAAAENAPAPAVEPARPSAVVRPAAEVRLPSDVGEHAIDCNMPAHWSGDTLHVLTSGGGIPKPLPRRCAGPDLFRLADAGEVRIDNDADFHRDRWGRWFEATWQDGSGALYGWYHHEPGDCCPEPRRSFALTSPRIGAAVSRDDGRTWTDLGIVLAAPPGSDDCRTANLFFAGGHGDFTVVPDASREHLYFLFSTYCGPAQEQGVAVARMCAADRDAPVGRVFKWRDGAWGEAGVGGRCTPVFPAAGSWHGTAPDAFWGPSVHWNTHLGQFVMLVNRTRSSNWAQEGAYVSFNPDIGDPRGWSRPTKIRDGGEYYVQVIGAARGETDKEAGRVARLFVHGRSHEEIVFLRPGEPAAAP